MRIRCWTPGSRAAGSPAAWRECWVGAVGAARSLARPRASAESSSSFIRGPSKDPWSIFQGAGSTFFACADASSTPATQSSQKGCPWYLPGDAVLLAGVFCGAGGEVSGHPPACPPTVTAVQGLRKHPRGMAAWVTAFHDSDGQWLKL